MTKAILLVLLTLVTSACTSSNLYEIFRTAHEACYGYSYGTGPVEVDYEKAHQFCRESHMEGNNSGTTLYAELFFLGHGVERDLSKAASLYLDAAVRGHPHAQFMVAAIYLKSPTSTAQQRQLGRVYLTMAAMRGHEQARALLHELFESNPDQSELDTPS